MKPQREQVAPARREASPMTARQTARNAQRSRLRRLHDRHPQNNPERGTPIHDHGRDNRQIGTM